MIHEAKLEKCPFCGGEAKIVRSRRWPRHLDYAIQAYSPICPNVNCVIYNADHQYYETELEAITKWNTRSTKS